MFSVANGGKVNIKSLRFISLTQTFIAFFCCYKFRLNVSKIGGGFKIEL